MSNAREHHAKAEQLLKQADTTKDQTSRRLILAEAQVHATLALTAPASWPETETIRGRQQSAYERFGSIDVGDLKDQDPGGPAPVQPTRQWVGPALSHNPDMAPKSVSLDIENLDIENPDIKDPG